MADPRHRLPGVRAAAVGWVLLLAAGCLPVASGSPASPSPTASPLPSSTPPASSSATATSSASALPTPAPLSLDLPSRRDQRAVDVAIDALPPDDDNGEIVVTITSRSERTIGELVLRWPTALRDTLFLAPFRPSEQRTADGGPPLTQEWTKWVDGPGESGEPPGTTSLGWGPLLPGATLTVPIQVTRAAPGAVAFDLQVLAGESILSQPNGEPAELRVSLR